MQGKNLNSVINWVLNQAIQGLVNNLWSLDLIASQKPLVLAGREAGNKTQHTHTVIIRK